MYCQELSNVLRCMISLLIYLVNRNLNWITLKWVFMIIWRHTSTRLLSSVYCRVFNCEIQILPVMFVMFQHYSIKIDVSLLITIEIEVYLLFYVCYYENDNEAKDNTSFPYFALVQKCIRLTLQEVWFLFCLNLYK